MPQQSLLPSVPVPTKMVITLTSWPRSTSPDTVGVLVMVTSDPGRHMGGWGDNLVHNERDYLNTLVEAATMAFMYGEGSRDIAKACAAVKKLARVHERNTSP